MGNLEKIKLLIDADPAVVGDDFYENLAKKLEKALASQGASLEQAHGGALAIDLHDGSGSGKALSDDFTGQVDDMERHISLNKEYEIRSRLGGLAGAVHKLVKKVVVALKLKTDVQVHQQARFNMAVFVYSHINMACLDLLQERINDLENRHTATIEELKAEIARIKEKIDDR